MADVTKVLASVRDLKDATIAVRVARAIVSGGDRSGSAAEHPTSIWTRHVLEALASQVETLMKERDKATKVIGDLTSQLIGLKTALAARSAPAVGEEEIINRTVEWCLTHQEHFDVRERPGAIKVNPNDPYFLTIEPDRIKPGELLPGSAAHRQKRITAWQHFARAALLSAPVQSGSPAVTHPEQKE